MELNSHNCSSQKFIRIISLKNFKLKSKPIVKVARERERDYVSFYISDGFMSRCALIKKRKASQMKLLRRFLSLSCRLKMRMCFKEKGKMMKFTRNFFPCDQFTRVLLYEMNLRSAQYKDLYGIWTIAHFFFCKEPIPYSTSSPFISTEFC